MKKIFFYAFVILLSKVSFAQNHEAKTMMWDGVSRQYLVYVPQNLTAPAPVLFCLHGLGDNMNSFASSCNFNSIADQNGWIIITPQALTAVLPLIGSVTAWNSGIAGSYQGTDIAVNADVDDTGFLMAILDLLIENHNIDQSQVFFTGFSMGGFMTNRMAIEHGDRISAIASVSGTIATPISTNTPVAKINAMHIHGTADEVVSYSNASFGIFGSVGLGAEATVEYWRNHNQCNSTPEIYNYPDLVNDGITFKRYIYSGGAENTTTVFIKAVGGRHTYYYKPANDIDYKTEIFNFFTNQLVSSIAENEQLQFSIYPNPTNDILFIDAENIIQIDIYDIHGRMAKSEATNGQINVSDLNQGVYLIKIQTADQQKVMKFIVKPK